MFRLVSNMGGAHGELSADGGLQKRGLEREHAGAVRTSAFGENTSQHAGMKCMGEGLIDAGNVAALLPLDEQGPRLYCDWSYNRPVRHFRLGYKNQRIKRAQQHDIHKADMVADKHPAVWNVTLRLNRDLQMGQQGAADFATMLRADAEDRGARR